MGQRLIRVSLLATVICYACSERNKYAAISNLSRKKPVENELFVSIIRGENSSNLQQSSNDTGQYDRSLEKQSRATVHRAESESRGSSCCGPRHGSGASTRPDTYHNKIPVDSNRYSSQYGERLPIDRYGWQAQGQPPDSSGNTRRPGGGNHGVLYEGNQGDRFSFRPSYGNGNSHRPYSYETGTSDGYGYGNGGYGGHGTSRPTSSSGSSVSSSYGISGILANGDEFGSVEPNYPEGSAPSVPNIQAQKAVALKALAGVALIGAAAALATNPVLLPIGLVSGRRKRSNLPVREGDARMQFISRILDNKPRRIGKL
ncbi:uncharacterized protein LOC116426904 isoform X1 [Nomia melanderi]|uniref:uncharacterized protein LOC116426904 isoform X1 n=1 Tax=Nomia melanderi TaxID=2448451 RepID=UPI003FCC56C9